jgi:hypothetical protein
VSRGETNSRCREWKVSFNPRGAPHDGTTVRREHETRVARCKFSSARELAFLPPLRVVFGLEDLSRAPTARTGA